MDFRELQGASDLAVAPSAPLRYKLAPKRPQWGESRAGRYWMNLNHLRHLLAVADSGSFRSAAKRLNISQAAITKSMKALETEFGVPLISRGSQSSALTASGLELLTHARSVCTEIDYASARIKRLSGEADCRISIGTIATASLRLLPETVRFFRSRYPQSVLTVVTGFTGFLLPRILEGSLDIVIGSELDGPLPAGVRFDKLFSAEYCIVTRQGHPLEGATSLAQLSDSEWIMPTQLGKGTSSFHRILRRLGLADPKIRIHSDCPFFFLQMVATSDLVGLFRRYILDQNILPSSAKIINFADITIDDRIGVYSRAQHSNSFMVDELVESLKERAARFDQ